MEDMDRVATLKRVLEGNKSREVVSLPLSQQPSTKPLYDWEAWYAGNIIQKWWKHSIARTVYSMTNQADETLDIGCGSSPLISHYTNAAGVDIDSYKVDFMRRMYPKLAFYHAEGSRILVPSEKYDQVLIIEVIEHVEKPAAMLQEAFRVLRPRGKLIIATPNYGSFIWLAVEKLYGIFMRDGYESDHYNAYNRKGIIRLCERNGFQHKETRQVALCDLVLRFEKIQFEE